MFKNRIIRVTSYFDSSPGIPCTRAKKTSGNYTTEAESPTELGTKTDDIIKPETVLASMEIVRLVAKNESI